MFKWIFQIFHIGETPTARIGRLGESASVKYLKSEKSMRIIKRNARIKKQEMDIIALDGDTLVFVEVKTRSQDAIVDGYYSASSKNKMQNLRKFASAYISAMRKKPRTWLFDAIEVRHDNSKIISISHFENIG